jgi:hypothetical protein
VQLQPAPRARSLTWRVRGAQSDPAAVVRVFQTNEPGVGNDHRRPDGGLIASSRGCRPVRRHGADERRPGAITPASYIEGAAVPRITSSPPAMCQNCSQIAIVPEGRAVRPRPAAGCQVCNRLTLDHPRRHHRRPGRRHAWRISGVGGVTVSERMSTRGEPFVPSSLRVRTRRGHDRLGHERPFRDEWPRSCPAASAPRRSFRRPPSPVACAHAPRMQHLPPGSMGRRRP